MKSILIVFKSRHEAMDFYNSLVSIRTKTLVNTPDYLGLGCGLSVRIDSKYRSIVPTLLQDGGYKTYQGVFIDRRSK